MKKRYLLILLLGLLVQLRAANVVPVTGKFYNIVQTPSNMVFGVSGTTQPAVQAKSNSLSQAFEFVPVDGKTDTYYIRNYYGKYLNKLSSSGWSTVYEAATNGLSSEWVIVDDASATTNFRLKLNFNSKYLATDATTENSYMYCDKAADHVRGLFTLQEAVIPTELVNVYNTLSLGDLTQVKGNLTLPTTNGNVTIVWTSSQSSVISTTGVVTRPEQYDATVVLTATMTQTVDGTLFTMVKQFTATVVALNLAGEQLARWDFMSNRIGMSGDSIIITDSISGFRGFLMNDASVRTIGGATSGMFNVLDLGNGKGYLDMGLPIGKAIYSLNNYTMCGYFRIDDAYTEIGSNGNFYWTFSNSADAATDKNGYIIGSLKETSQSVSSGYWATGNQAVGAATTASKGSWHHFAYVQDGTTGKVFVDGAMVASGTMTNLPSTTLPIAGRTGTLYNWLGRSNYSTDVYLRNTLLYGFELYRVPLSADDFAYSLEVPTVIEQLNNAYAENPTVPVTSLQDEATALTLGNLTAVTSNLTLPAKGTTDQTVVISWATSNANLITSKGVVTRPDFYNYTDTLTATLTKNGQKVTKKFYATVVAKDNSQFTGSNLVKFDFSSVSDSVVTDAAEKHFKGTLKNGATVVSIGNTTTGVYKVLSLGDSIGYFDMGEDVGKILYNLNDFSMSAYYRIHKDYPDASLAANGNFLWSFSNVPNILNDYSGYVAAILKNQYMTISSSNWSAEQGVNFNTTPLKDGWHHIAYTQSGTNAQLYIDGIAMLSGTVTITPATALAKAGNLGTKYNWIGRSCYAGDAYLRKTLVSDFRIYNKALTVEEVMATELNVGNTIDKLNAAYDVVSSLPSITNSPYSVYSETGTIRIKGVTSADNVAVVDVTGRAMKVDNKNMITVKAGVYIVTVNNYVAKVVVK